MGGVGAIASEVDNDLSWSIDCQCWAKKCGV